ncbi:MAG: hypothetical protein B6244_03520 [Candidatus Cloacimonetes bacterium 4572_55]|nr:MAG: hypothetical protein B6244_03520 [Candidatus Cloacimonetes bacterium 4572_55]
MTHVNNSKTQKVWIMNEITVLIVEDEVIVAANLKRRLENFGYRVCGIAPSGEAAIEKADQFRPDMIFMDIMLETDMDGVEAAEHIRRQFDIPVVFVTAFSDEQTLQRAKITEPYGYIIKPFNMKELQTIVEITVYKHDIEKKMRENRQWIMTILNNIHDAIIVVNTEEQITFMNPTVEHISKLTSDEVMGKHFGSLFTFMCEKNKKEIKNVISKVIESGQPQDTVDNHILINRHGDQIQIEYNLAPIIDEAGKVTDVIFVFRDITKRKEAEELLRIKEIAMRNSINAIAITDLMGNITYVNKAFLKLWGYEKEQNIFGGPSANFWQLEDNALEVIEKLTGEESWIGMIRATHRDRKSMELELSATMVIDDLGNPVCMMTSFVDPNNRLIT